MEALKSLEMSLVKATKDLPHLPKGLTTWLVENAWWLVLIGVVIGVIAVFPLIGAVMLVGGVSAVYLGLGYGAMYLVS